MWLSAGAQINQHLCVLHITHSTFVSRGFCPPQNPTLLRRSAPPPTSPHYNLSFTGRTIRWTLTKVKEWNRLNQEAVRGSLYLPSCQCVFSQGGTRVWFSVWHKEEFKLWSFSRFQWSWCLLLVSPSSPSFHICPAFVSVSSCVSVCVWGGGFGQFLYIYILPWMWPDVEPPFITVMCRDATVDLWKVSQCHPEPCDLLPLPRWLTPWPQAEVWLYFHYLILYIYTNTHTHPVYILDYYYYHYY